MVFLTSCICFSSILIKRFSSFYVTFFGTLAYCFSPKIYGASFFDGKDLFFLSLFTITIYFYQKFEIKQKSLNLFLFILFAAFLTSTRPPGLMIAISFIFIYILMFISNLKEKNNLKIISYFISIYLILLYTHWPYLWNFLEYNIDQMFFNANVTFFLMENFINKDLYHFLTFLNGFSSHTNIYFIFYNRFSFSFKRFFELINIREGPKYYINTIFGEVLKRKWISLYYYVFFKLLLFI